MAYAKQTWVDGVTPLDAEHLNHMEQGISTAGADGKSAYQFAQEGGFTGTEAEFAAKLAVETYSKSEIDTIMGAYINDIDTLVGGEG